MWGRTGADAARLEGAVSDPYEQPELSIRPERRRLGPLATMQMPSIALHEAAESLRRGTLDTAAQIRREQVSYLRRGSALSFLLHPVAAVLALVTMLGRVPHQWMAVWVVAVWAMAGIRAILWHRYRRGVDDAEWPALFTAVAIGSSLLWGAAPMVIWPDGALMAQALLFVTIAATTAIDMVAMASFMAAAIGSLAAVLLGLFAALAWHGALAPVTVATIFIYAAVLAIGAYYINRLLLDGLRLRFDLAAATAAAQAASKAKSEFIANMSHELRTPLNAIIGFSEVMKDAVFGKDAPPRYVGYACDIHKSGTHLLEIINDILDLCKIEAGRVELKEERVDLGDVIRSSLTLVADRAEQSGVALDAHVPAPAPVIRGDGRAIKQALLNLLSNAVKFTPIGGSVLVDIRREEHGALVVVVQDTGIGMSPADIPKAMEAFGQLENVHTRKRAGTGLGLPIARSLVEMHGGQLRLVSELGAGTSAEIALPARRVIAA
jgi:two-component system cell cycle sensor histidine kinase PleC